MRNFKINIVFKNAPDEIPDEVIKEVIREAISRIDGEKYFKNGQTFKLVYNKFEKHMEH